MSGPSFFARDEPWSSSSSWRGWNVFEAHTPKKCGEGNFALFQSVVPTSTFSRCAISSAFTCLIHSPHGAPQGVALRDRLGVDHVDGGFGSTTAVYTRTSFIASASSNSVIVLVVVAACYVLFVCALQAFKPHPNMLEALNLYSEHSGARVCNFAANCICTLQPAPQFRWAFKCNNNNSDQENMLLKRKASSASEKGAKKSKTAAAATDGDEEGPPTAIAAAAAAAPRTMSFKDAINAFNAKRSLIRPGGVVHMATLAAMVQDPAHTVKLEWYLADVGPKYRWCRRSGCSWTART